MRPPITQAEATQRLLRIFPRAAFDTAMSSPAAGLAISTFIHIDAVCAADDDLGSVRWARPSAVMWMSDAALARSDDADRLAYRSAALRGESKVTDLHSDWGERFLPIYKGNSRENLRDETFPLWVEHGALRRRGDKATTYPGPIWALIDDFADLFDPALADEEFQSAAEQWRTHHMDPGKRLRAKVATQTEALAHAVVVGLPGGGSRTLEPGKSSLIIKGVIEEWAPRRLIRPRVLAISEPGDKVNLGEAQLLQALGITINPSSALPDVLIADIGTDPEQFWIVEAVGTDGPVDEPRRRELLEWATQQNIKTGSCAFLTAFRSRNDPATRRRLKDLASGTWAWFADEPGHELAWYQLHQTGET